MTTGDHFYFNAEFDFSLRGSVSDSILRGSQSMASFFAPALESSQVILTNEHVPSAFFDTLGEYGLTAARTKPLKSVAPGTSVDAWGWSDSAVENLTAFGYHIDAPSPAVCRFCNSRAFSLLCAERHGSGVPRAKLLTSAEMTAGILQTETTPFVLKPLFGNSAAGFIHCVPPVSEKQYHRIESIIATEPLIFEPWLDRIDDLATVAELSQSGTITVVGHHHNLCNRAGSFYGTLVAHDDPVLEREKERLNRIVHRIGAELYAAGYWGVFSIDSFSYQENGTLLWAEAIDINARFTMSYIAHRVAEKLHVPALLYRYLARKRVPLPETYDKDENPLQGITYDRQQKVGVLHLSPLRTVGIDGVSRQPARSAFAIVDGSTEGVLARDEAFRKRVLPRR